MAIKSRQRGRPQGRSSSFQRRLTWREVEASLDHLFDVALDDDEAQRIVRRFARARSQLLPVLSGMVVSPYERERLVALDLLRRMGGAATAKMLDDVLGSEDIHRAYKLEVQRVREALGPIQPESEAEEGEEDEARLERAGLRAADEGEELEPGDEVVAVEAEAEPAGEPEAGGRRRAGRGRSRRRRRRGDGEEAPLATVSPEVFAGPAEAILPLLDGPVEPVHAAFATLALPKRLSFIDRSSRVKDQSILAFLLPILETNEWALVQSTLQAIDSLGFVEALPAVERLAAGAQRKRIQLRAERVRDALRAAAPASAPAAPAAEPAPAAPEPRPRPIRPARGRAVEWVAEPEMPAAPAESTGLGLLAPPEPTPLRGQGAPVSEDRLPRLRACLAGGVGIDGEQRLVLYRQGSEQTTERLALLLHERGGWLGQWYHRGLAADQPRLDAAQAAAVGRGLVEVTVGYLRGRVLEVVEAAEQAGVARPEALEPALAFIGAGRKAEPTEGVTAAPASQEQVEALLNHPLFRDWRLALEPGGEAVARWSASSGKRSASRVRRRLIDEVAEAWTATALVAGIPARLRLQAALLERSGENELAAAALGEADTLARATAVESRLLRELVYRGFQAALDARHRSRARARQMALRRADRQRHARSTFRRGRRH